MQLFLPAGRVKALLVTLLVLLGVISYIHNRYLISTIQEQESASVELWARAVEYTTQPMHVEVSTGLNSAIQTLTVTPGVPDSIISILEDAEAAQSSIDFISDEIILDSVRINIPRIVVSESGEILSFNDVDENEVDSDLLAYYASINDPIQITIGGSLNNYVYYGESPTVRYLRYVPYLQLALLLLLLGIGFTTYKSITRSEQSNLWVGMAKEAAHQLGTPISSLYGWLELLKEKQATNDYVMTITHEIENDITRLRGIAERFNKIGSEPELREMDIVPIIEQVIEYMERRLPQLGRNVEVRKSIETDAKVRVNPELFQWAVENLMKNAMDAIRENSTDAYVAIRVKRLEDELFIDIEDSGSGIDKKNLTEVFKPGFSTKKRGWGLGLSLTRRIIEEYHNGQITILRSGTDQGTTVRITMQC